MITTVQLPSNCYQTTITTLLTSIVYIKIQTILNNLYMYTHQYTYIHLQCMSMYSYVYAHTLKSIILLF